MRSHVTTYLSRYIDCLYRWRSYVEITCAEFHADCSGSMESTCEHSFTPLLQVWWSLRRYSRSSLFFHILYIPIPIFMRIRQTLPQMIKGRCVTKGQTWSAHMVFFRFVQRTKNAYGAVSLKTALVLNRCLQSFNF